MCLLGVEDIQYVYSWAWLDSYESGAGQQQNVSLTGGVSNTEMLLRAVQEGDCFPGNFPVG